MQTAQALSRIINNIFKVTKITIKRRAVNRNPNSSCKKRALQTTPQT